MKELLTAGTDGWWRDAEMFGVIGRVPDLLKSIVPVFVSFFGGGRIEPHLFELMRIKRGQSTTAPTEARCAPLPCSARWNPMSTRS